MEICVCNEKTRGQYGYRATPDGHKCNYCEGIQNDTGGESELHGEPSIATLASSSIKKSPIKSFNQIEKRLDGINNIILRMWWWIGIQSLFFGMWAGNNLGTGSELIYGNYAEFDFGFFMVAILVGVGAFAPLVFVVEALREVVINLVKGPITDKSETK